jgi:hypothetical protein
MSPSDNLSEMSSFFIVVLIKAVKDMVCKDIALFQEIWEQTDEEQGEVSLLDIRRYLQHHDDIDMGWINVHWGVPQVLDASTSLPNESSLALNKVVEQRRVSLFPVQLTIEGALRMLCLEASFNFTAISWGIQVHKKNESKSLDE